jgi:hypothetical protein
MKEWRAERVKWMNSKLRLLLCPFESGENGGDLDFEQQEMYLYQELLCPKVQVRRLFCVGFEEAENEKQQNKTQ